MPTAPLLSIVCARARFVLRQRLFNFRARFQNAANAKPGFFDAYPRFYASTKVGSTANRLNRRYEALIENNRNLIAGHTILDLASHDGRWSFAAWKAGAAKVTGIEARERLVCESRRVLHEYGVPSSQFEFILGNLTEILEQLTPGAYDTVFCYGFLYHTMHHMSVLTKIRQLNPHHLIVDTDIDVDPGCIIEVDDESIALESAGAIADQEDLVVKGTPTKAALEFMLTHTGFGNFRYFDWHGGTIRNWTKMADYYLGHRVSLVADAVSPRCPSPWISQRKTSSPEPEFVARC